MPRYIFLADLMRALLERDEVLLVVPAHAAHLDELLRLVGEERERLSLSQLLIMSDDQYRLALRTCWPLPVERFDFEPLRCEGCKHILMPSADACQLCIDCFLGD